MKDAGGSGYFLAFLIDFGYSACSATGDTIEEALRNLTIVQKDVIKHYRETGKYIPKPSTVPGDPDSRQNKTWKCKMKYLLTVCFTGYDSKKDNEIKKLLKKEDVSSGLDLFNEVRDLVFEFSSKQKAESAKKILKSLSFKHTCEIYKED